MSPIHSLHRRQAGEGRIGCIFWTLLMLAVGYVCWQMVPVKMKSVDLEQFMVRAAERASLQQRSTEKALRKVIMEEADELGLPLENDDLFIKRTGARIRIEATYTVPINLVVTTWDWEIKHSVERSIMRV